MRAAQPTPESLTSTARPSLCAAPGSDRRHQCVVCGHEWESMEDETAKHIRKAAEVNKTGPYCALCQHLEMADRYAKHRGYHSLQDALDYWEACKLGHPND